MGNFTSCISDQSQTARLIDLHGNFRQLKLPITVAELMLEEPGHILSPVDYLRRDRRVSALGADKELSRGKAYVLIPTKRVRSKMSESEMGLLESGCGKRKTKRCDSKVIPVVATAAAVAAEEKSGEEMEAGNDTGFLGYRLRQWKPTLEPIAEGF